jgi:hypothetical protein
MKLLFLENRHKTYFFEPIANQLGKNGHEIHWLVQNKQFLPSGNSQIYIIDYPSNKINGFNKDEGVEDVIKSDRQLNHFNKQDTSYFYYYNDKIEHYLKELNPDFVFGESTAFHELLTINNCEKQNILYLNPSTCRYPIGRFSFYKYDTLEPYLGSKELISNKDAEDVIDQIINRKTAPDYMKPSPVSKEQIIKDKVKKIYAFTKGEKYNTPSPLEKYKAEKKKDKNIEIWNTTALKNVEPDNSFKILYPLQMQPEANIDVWGKKYRDQTELIGKIAELLPNDCMLYVKPNPKSKYELTPELIKLVEAKANIKHLHHSTKMDDVLPNINIVITVTGTIAIECLLSNKPIVTMVKTINNKANNCVFINNLNKDLETIINNVKNNTFNTISNQEKIDFINALNTSSYKGLISDPFSDVNCVSKKNISDILVAFNSILNKQN